MSGIHNPHDALFKSFLKDINIAREFLEAYLPEHIKQHCNLSTLRMVPSAFVEDNLKQCFSDIIYAVNLKDSTDCIYVLIEQQSDAPPLMPFRMLRYKVGIMQWHLDQGHKKLPTVVPLVFYTGTARPYPGTTQLIDCFQHPFLTQIEEPASFLLIDSTVIPDAILRTHKHLAVLELVMKYIKIKDLVQIATELVNVLACYPLSVELVRCLAHYLVHEGESTDYQEFIRLMTQRTPYREDVMTFAEYFTQKGKEEGRQQGQQEGREEGREEGEREKALAIAKNMLAKGLDVALIKEVTGLADEEIIALMH